MPYPLSNPLGGCSSDQSTVGDHSVNRNWTKGLQPALRRNTVSVPSQSATSITNTSVQYSPAHSYNQLSPVYDPHSPYSYTRPFAQSSQEALFGIQTNLPFKPEPEFSPSNLSPSSATSQFYAAGQHFRGSTPSLASSNSTPPTGRSKHLPLTPDPNFQSGNQLPPSPNHYNNTKTNSPMLYSGSTGATPQLNALNIDDSGFRLTTSADASVPLKRQSSSVLLGSNFSSQNPRAHLDPLDFGGDLTALDAHTSNAVELDEAYSDFSINIISDEPDTRNVPVSVALDNQSGTWNPPLSPLHFNALPLTYDFNDAAMQNQMYGVTIGRPNWTQLNVSPAGPSPRIPTIYSPHSVHSESLTPPSSQNVPQPETIFRGGTSSQGTLQGYESDPQEALEAVRNGQDDRVVNPRGVSDRTLLAAQANRKREAKFCCRICGNSQTSKQNLDNHIMSRHLQLKRFLCPVSGCNAKYGHARGVNRHLDSKHPGHRQVGVKGKRGPPKRTPT